MANRTRSRRSRRRRGGNIIPATKTEPARNRLVRSPPSLSMTSNSCTLWLRSEITVSTNDQAYFKQLSIKELIDDRAYGSMFAVYRCKRVNVWFIPSVSLTTSGLYSLAVADAGMNTLSTITYSIVSCIPGSDTKRIYQPTVSCWFPTEPDDLNWRPTASKKPPKVTDVMIATTAQNASPALNIVGSLVIDVHMTFRGINTVTGYSIINHPSIFKRKPDPRSLGFEMLDV